jgi:hypothetical protein
MHRTYDNHDERHQLEQVASAARELLLLATSERIAIQQPPNNFPCNFELSFE